MPDWFTKREVQGHARLLAGTKLACGTMLLGMPKKVHAVRSDSVRADNCTRDQSLGRLLKPISGEIAAGEPLRYSSGCSVVVPCCCAMTADIRKSLSNSNRVRIFIWTCLAGSLGFGRIGRLTMWGSCMNHEP